MRFQPSGLDNLYGIHHGNSYESDNIATDSFKSNAGRIVVAGRAIKGLAESTFDTLKGIGDEAIGYQFGVGKNNPFRKDADEDYKAAAKANTIDEQTTSNHKFVAFGAEILPSIALGVLTGGTSAVAEGAAEGAAEGVSVLSMDAIEEQTAQKLAKNAVENSVEPATLRTVQQARHIGMNKALKLAKNSLITTAITEPQTIASSLTLDNQGNVHVSLESLLLGNAMGAGAPWLGEIVGKGFKSINRMRLNKKIVKEVKKKITLLDESKKDIGAINPKEDDVIPAAKTSEIDGILKNSVNSLEKEGGETVDLELPEDTDPDPSIKYSLSEIGDVNHLHRASIAIKKMVKYGIKKDNQHYDFADINFHDQVKSTIHNLKQIKNNRGREKVSLSKYLDSYECKYKYILNKSQRTPYRNEAKDFFYQFHANSYDVKDDHILQDAARDGDDHATAILALRNLSATAHLDSSLLRMKMLDQYISLYKGGILDYAENWGKNDRQMLNEFTQRVFKENADYFSDPFSKGYVLITKNDRAFKELVACLVDFS